MLNYPKSDGLKKHEMSRETPKKKFFFNWESLIFYFERL